MTSEMLKFVCKYYFSIALTKINLKKSPWPPKMYILVSCKPGFYFTVFLFFFKLVCQRFYMKHYQFYFILRIKYKYNIQKKVS